MDMDLDKDSLSCIAKEIDWESIFPEVEKLKDSPSFYISQLIHVLDKRIRVELANFDLTNTQFSMLTSLLILTRDGKVITQMDLAKFLKADKMMVSEVLRTLERKGCIIRVSHPNDKRAKSLIITEKGRATIEKAVKTIVLFDEQFFSKLGEDRGELIRIINKLLE